LSMSTLVCVNCNARCSSEQLYCRQCGCILLSSLSDEALSHATKTLANAETNKSRLEWGTSYFHQNAHLNFQIGDTNHIVAVPAIRGPVVIGRRGGSVIPHIDLTPYDAQDFGVSRYHLRIERKAESLYVTDLDSANGTYLNRQRLVPNVPHLLRNRGILILGNLLLRAEFV
jgi:hypothetical protein